MLKHSLHAIKNNTSYKQTYMQLIKMVSRQIRAKLMVWHSAVEHKPSKVLEN